MTYNPNLDSVQYKRGSKKIGNRYGVVNIITGKLLTGQLITPWTWTTKERNKNKKSFLPRYTSSSSEILICKNYDKLLIALLSSLIVPEAYKEEASCPSEFECRHPKYFRTSSLSITHADRQNHKIYLHSNKCRFDFKNMEEIKIWYEWIRKTYPKTYISYSHVLLNELEIVKLK